MNDYYDYLPLGEYEAELATRKYRDDAGAEWKMSSIETKLLLLATFVRRGGKLNRVINSYAKGRERTYRVTIQHCVMSYIAKLMGSNDYFLRIILLSKREVIELLTELLKANVMIVGAKGLPPLPKGLRLSDNDGPTDSSQDNNNRVSQESHRPFAYISGDQLIIEGTGTLQAYDMMGRLIFRENVSTYQHINVSSFPQTGVYILLLNGQSQKIIIRKQ